jgi:NAD-specific glutamate dehydrogenase
MHNGSTETETQNSETSDDATRSDGGVGAKRAHTRGDRRQLILRKVAESTIWKDDVERERANFLVQSVVRRADDDFLQRHPAEAAAPHLQYALRKVDSRKNDKILVGCAIPAVATHGYDLPVVALETSMSDQPFIVDTIKLVLRRLRVRALGTMNMILPVERDEDGTLLDISLENSNAANESFTCHLLSRSSAEARVEEIRAAVLFSLERAKVASNDFRSMRKLVRDVASTLNYCAESMPDRAPEFLELAAFGDWLVNDNFVFLGAYGFDEQNRPTGRLGLGRFETTERPGVETRPQFAFGSHSAAGVDPSKPDRFTGPPRLADAGNSHPSL